ncbi:MAG: cupin domain-containing protein [Pseudomonadota bacterium]
MTRLFLTLFFACALASGSLAQEVLREEIRRVPVPGSDTMEVIVVKLTIEPGATMEMHSHHGDEHAVVIAGGKARLPNGQETEFPVGATLYFPKGAVHGGLTALGDPLVAITTSIVEVGKPLIIPAN